LLLELSRKTESKEEAYRIVQDNAMKAWTEKGDFEELVRGDRRVRRLLSARSVEDCFSLEHYLRHVDYIFKRVFK
jgi:adenylosuccinate lyase